MGVRTESGNAFARRIFDSIANSYEAPARLFSFFQYDRWHRYLVSKLALNSQSVLLDVCTGTGMVAMRVADAARCKVVGLDLSPLMLREARRNVRARNPEPPIELVQGRAESLPFPDCSFDAVIFTYLLRYVNDPQAVLDEMTRVLKPGGQIASLEFYIPQGVVRYPLWLIHTRLLMPLAARIFSHGWGEVGSFLGPSISDFYRKYSLQQLCRIWQEASIAEVQVKQLSLGGGLVMWGRKESKYEDGDEARILRAVQR